MRDITSWVLGFSAYVGVIALKQPEKVPYLMGYMAQIVQASRQFQRTPWAEYDTRFRMQAAAQQCTRLAKLDTTLWTIAFVNAEPAHRCRWCFSVDHPSGDCDEKPEEEEDKESTLNKRRKLFQESKQPIWNRGVCRSSWCSFRHICIECHGTHTKQDCPHLSRKTAVAQGEQRKKPTSNALVGFAENTSTRAHTSHNRDSYISESTQKYSRTGYTKLHCIALTASLILR